MQRGKQKKCAEAGGRGTGADVGSRCSKGCRSSNQTRQRLGSCMGGRRHMACTAMCASAMKIKNQRVHRLYRAWLFIVARVGSAGKLCVCLLVAFIMACINRVLGRWTGGRWVAWGRLFSCSVGHRRWRSRLLDNVPRHLNHVGGAARQGGSLLLLRRRLRRRRLGRRRQGHHGKRLQALLLLLLQCAGAHVRKGGQGRHAGCGRPRAAVPRQRIPAGGQGCQRRMAISQ